MARLSYTEIRPRKIILLNSQIYEVLDSQVTKKSRQKASNQTKLKNIKTGAVIQYAFHAKDNIEEVDVEKEKFIFIYKKGNEVCVRNINDKNSRQMVSVEIVKGVDFMKDGEEIFGLCVDEEIVALNPPLKVELEVVEAPPSDKGDTAQGGVKQVVLETGAKISTPLFVQSGDVVVVNTERAEYVMRTKN